MDAAYKRFRLEAKGSGGVYKKGDSYVHGVGCYVLASNCSLVLGLWLAVFVKIYQRIASNGFEGFVDGDLKRVLLG